MITITNLTLALTHPNTIYITNKELKLAAGRFDVIQVSVRMSQRTWGNCLARGTLNGMIALFCHFIQRLTLKL